MGHIQRVSKGKNFKEENIESMTLFPRKGMSAVKKALYAFTNGRL